MELTRLVDLYNNHREGMLNGDVPVDHLLDPGTCDGVHCGALSILPQDANTPRHGYERRIHPTKGRLYKQRRLVYDMIYLGLHAL
jgi:hypothetical protein